METQTAPALDQAPALATARTALQVTTRVLPGKRIEISASELEEGEAVDIILLLPPAADRNRPSALDVIRSLHGHKVFRTAEEVDRYLDEERNSWDR